MRLSIRLMALVALAALLAGCADRVPDRAGHAGGLGTAGSR